MSETHPSNVNTLQTDCRRSAERTACPIEIEIETNDGHVLAVVRDVSIDRNAAANTIGIAIFHQAELKNGQPVNCRTLESSEPLPDEFQLELKWSRRFGPEGYLSGGLIHIDGENA